jgi:hypothetical protein
LDLDEILGNLESTRAVYERILDLRIATPEIILNYAFLLEVCAFLQYFYYYFLTYFLLLVSMDWQAFYLFVFFLGINIWITTIRGLWSWAQRSRSMELNNTCEKKRIVVLGMFSQKEDYLNCWKNFIHVLISLCYSIYKHYFSIALCSQPTIYLTYASNVSPWYLYRDASQPKWYGRHCHQNHLIFPVLSLPPFRAQFLINFIYLFMYLINI